MTEYRSQTGFVAFFVAVDCKSWGQNLYSYDLNVPDFLFERKSARQAEDKEFFPNVLFDNGQSRQITRNIQISQEEEK